MQALLAMGVDGLISDVPDIALAARDGLGPGPPASARTAL
jgi:hypothetical protein